MDKWDKRFMEMVKVIAGWSSCYQHNRKIGAIIVKNKRILTTGYNGAPSGYPSCVERQECIRRIREIPQEPNMNTVMPSMLSKCYRAGRKIGGIYRGATLYCTHQPCVICAKLIVNSGIIRWYMENHTPIAWLRNTGDCRG